MIEIIKKNGILKYSDNYKDIIIRIAEIESLSCNKNDELIIGLKSGACFTLTMLYKDIFDFMDKALNSGFENFEYRKKV